ncbi:MAG TPA: ABC transporter permease [Usitatibacter sp.]|nr:ABC transporter permease [Usitatibacter sp.]
MKALLALVRKDIVLYFANRRAVAITLAAPILIAGFFGYVFGGPPRAATRVPVAIVDLDGSSVSRAIVEEMKRDPSFELTEASEADAVRRVREGAARAAAVIPHGFGAEAPRAMFRPGAKKPEIVVHYDPSQPTAVTLVQGLLAQHAMTGVSRALFGSGAAPRFLDQARRELRDTPGMDEERRRDLLDLLDSVSRVQRDDAASGRTGGESGGFSIPFETRRSEVTGRVDRRYNGYSHSFAGMGVQFVLFMGIEMGVGLLLMRRLGIWRRLRAAPVSRALLLGSRVLSGTVIAALLLCGIYAAAMAFFGVRIDGSIAGFVAVALAFAVLTSTFGLLIAALGRTPEATRGLAVLATLLLVMLGGAWVPTFVFPEWLQQATRFVPTRWAIDGFDATTWRGLGIAAVLPGVAAMLAASALFAWIAVRRFDWEE